MGVSDFIIGFFRTSYFYSNRIYSILGHKKHFIAEKNRIFAIKTSWSMDFSTFRIWTFLIFRLYEMKSGLLWFLKISFKILYFLDVSSKIRIFQIQFFEIRAYFKRYFLKIIINLVKSRKSKYNLIFWTLGTKIIALENPFFFT